MKPNPGAEDRNRELVRFVEQVALMGPSSQRGLGPDPGTAILAAGAKRFTDSKENVVCLAITRDAIAGSTPPLA